jgi:D-sedoheptulose 7-phosphate isomerase
MPTSDSWDEYRGAIASALDRVSMTDRGGRALGAADGFQLWLDLTRDVHARGDRIFFAGNGASAAMASHFAADACKNGGLRAQVFHDAALVTCVANDVSFEQVFALPLSRLGRAGDMLITISSSGASPNIVRALECARHMGLRIVTLSGRKTDNPSRGFGDLNVYLPCERYGWIESAHHVILHYWLDQYLNQYGEGAL